MMRGPNNRFKLLNTIMNSTQKLLSAGAGFLVALAFAAPAYGQGCVQSRGAGAGVIIGEDTYLSGGEWQASLGYRWLHSDRHFAGTDEFTGQDVGGGNENKSRNIAGDQIINNQNFIDMTATYALTKRYSMSFTLPFVDSTRSQPVAVKTKPTATTLGTVTIYDRFQTEAAGVGDASLRANAWVFDPDKHPDGNLQLGLGIKFPTGDNRAKDVFESRLANGTIVAQQNFVDQSIQPGDGGWGAILQIEGFQKIVSNTYAYLDMNYLINPQEKDAAPPVGTGYSIPDTYLLRSGLTYVIWPAQGLSLSLGARMEGVPVEDWIGGSAGSRRPGYAISIEPGVTWVYKKWAFTVTAPVAIERNRERSVSDIANGSHGDAAFADYIITSAVSYRF